MDKKKFECAQCGKRFHRNAILLQHIMTHTVDKPHECIKCGRRFISKYALNSHMNRHAGNMPYQCAKCGNGYSQQIYLIEHILTHSGESPYLCLQCGKPFTEQSDLLTHIKQLHSDNTLHDCPQCGKQFKRKFHLQEHILIHTGEKPHKCTHCDQQFARKHYLVRHLRVHSDKTPFECSVCGQRFKQKATLKKHKTVHIGDKTYNCTKCGKKFRQKSSLKEHLRLHAGLELYKCSVCEKKFKYKNSLAKHLMRHTGKIPFQCSGCDKGFQYKVSLVEHMRIHSGEKPHECLDCGKRFRQKTALSAHKFIHSTDKPYKCSVCAKGFSQKSNFDLHMQLHTGERPQQCAICDARYRFKSSLTNHMLQHEEGMPQCLKCGKVFKKKIGLKNHMMVHGDRPYQCLKCGKRYERNSGLKKHMIIHTNKENEVHTVDVLKPQYIEAEEKVKRELQEVVTLKRYKNSLSVDMLQDSGEMPQCLVCGKRFEKKIEFKNHILVHGDRWHECTKCGKQYEQNSGFIKHLLLHVKIEKEIHAVDESKGTDIENKVKMEIQDVEFVGNFTMTKHELCINDILESLEIDVDNAITTKVQDKISSSMLHDEENVDEITRCREKLHEKEAFVKKQISNFQEIANAFYLSCNASVPITVWDNFKLDESKQVPFDKQFQNLWSFTWKLQPEVYLVNDILTDLSDSSFTMSIVKSFDDFLHKLTVNKVDNISHSDTHESEDNQWITILIHMNSMDEVMIVIFVPSDNPTIRNSLQNFLHSQPINLWKLKSLYYKTAESKAALSYGSEEFYEKVGEIKVELSPNMTFSLNISGIEMLAKTIEDYLISCPKTTLLGIGCGNGLIALLMAPKYKEIMGLGSSSDIKVAQKLCCYNNIKNATFVEDEVKKVDDLFKKLNGYDRVTAIVYHNAVCGLSTTMMKNLRKVAALRRIVIVTSFSEQCFPSLLTLMEPVDEPVNNPFIPLRSCIVDTMPKGNDFHYIIIMERQEISPSLQIVKEELIEDNWSDFNNIDYSSIKKEEL